MTIYSVMFCCNDERGNFTGRVEAIEVGEEIRLVWPSDRAPTLRFRDSTPPTVQVGRRNYPCRGRQCWVGNVCWDATSMEADTAHLFVDHLLASGWVVEEHAEDGLFANLVTPQPRPAREGK